MNFNDLYKKIATIDSTVIAESDMEECGEMMPPSMPKQSDSVTMNVSMNGSGEGGIRDLMNILRNLEKEGGHDHGQEPLVGDEGVEEEYVNQPETATADISAVTATGNDLHSQGAEAPKVNGGGNPMQVSEDLVNRLHELYQDVKDR